jgi:hypothetical protein
LFWSVISSVSERLWPGFIVIAIGLPAFYYWNRKRI